MKTPPVAAVDAAKRIARREHDGAAQVTSQRASSASEATVTGGVCPCGGGCPRCRPAVDAAIARDDGHPLSDEIRQRFETAFEHDFMHVRVHDGRDAHAAAAALDAEAFTRGADIWFGADMFAPGTSSGDRRLAHELTHVVQLDEGRLPVGVGPEVAPTHDPAEAYAYANEHAVVRRLGAGSAGAIATGPGEPPAVSARSSTPVATRIYRREPAAPPPAPVEAPPPVEEDALPAPATQTLEELARAIEVVSSKTAIELTAQVGAYRPLEDAVAYLDNRALLDRLFATLGTEAWSDPAARAAMLGILPLRTSERNEATIAAQVSKGLFAGDLRVSGEEARVAYEILHAMPDHRRAAFLASPEGQLAFERLPDRKRPALRLAKEFAFHDEDLDALLGELDRPDVWAPEQEAWLRVLFWMAVQSGRADDPRLVDFVTDNWDTHGHLFAEQGLRADGTLTLERLRETPHGAKLALRLIPFVVRTDLGGALSIVGAWFDGWGKKRRIDDIQISELQKALGGTLFGVRLDGFEGTPVTGELSIEVNPKEGELTITSTVDPHVPTVSWSGEGIAGEPITVTGRDLTLHGLTLNARWPADKTLASRDSLHLTLNQLTVGSVLASTAGQEAVRLSDLVISGIDFDVDLGPFREGDGTHLFKIIEHLRPQIESLTLVLHAALGAVASTLAPSTGDTTAVFTSELKRVLAERLGGELEIEASVGDVSSGTVTLFGETQAGLTGGFELHVAAGPRALAELEVRRLRAKGEANLTDEERIHIAELEIVQANPDRRAADDVLRSLRLVPDDLVLELASPADPNAPPLRLTGIELPVANAQVDEVVGARATLTLTVPHAGARLPASDGEQGETGPLFRIELDVAEGSAPLGGEMDVLGRTATAGPLTFKGLHGAASVLADGGIELDVSVAEIGCATLDWGISIDVPDGMAKGVHVFGALGRAEDGRYEIAKGAAITVEVASLEANQAVIESPGKFRAVAEGPSLTGLRVVVADGQLPTVHVDAGSLAGFDAAIGGILKADGTQPLTFRDFDARAMIALGVYHFSIGDLEARAVDFDAAGKRLAVEYFHGPIEGVVDDQLNGSVSLSSKEALRFGRMSVHLNPPSDRWAAVDLGWKTASLDAPTMTIGWAFASLGDAPDIPQVRALRVSLTGLHTAAATVTGLTLRTQFAGAPFALMMSARGEATIDGLRIPSLDLLISEDFLTAEGKVTGEGLVANGLIAAVGPLLELGLDAASGPLEFEALSDGTARFKLDDLGMGGDLTVHRGEERVDPASLETTPGEALMLRGTEPLRTWDVWLVAQATGGLGPSGVDVKLEGVDAGAGTEEVALDTIAAHVDKDMTQVDLGGGFYTAPHLTVDFQALHADVVLGKPGDRPVVFKRLYIANSFESLPILKLSNIRLTKATFVIDDLSALIGRNELVALFPTLAELAAAMSGRAACRLLTEKGYPNARMRTTITDGALDGTLSADVTFPGSDLLMPDVPFTGRLAPALEQDGATTDMLLVVLTAERFGVAETIETPFPLPDPLQVPFDVIRWPLPDPVIIGFDDIDVRISAKAPEVLPIPGVGELHVARAITGLDIVATGSTTNGLAVSLAVEPTSARAFLWDTIDFAAAGIRIDQGVDLELTFAGLAVRRVKGLIASGSIDEATLGIVGPK